MFIYVIYIIICMKKYTHVWEVCKVVFKLLASDSSRQIFMQWPKNSELFTITNFMVKNFQGDVSLSVSICHSIPLWLNFVCNNESHVVRDS